MLKQIRGSDIAFHLAVIFACVAAGALLAYISTLLDAQAHYLAFVPAVAVCSRLYDAIGAIVSAVLSSLTLWDWFIPPDGFALPSAEDTRHLLAFLAVSAVVSWIIRRERHSNDDLARENFELGYKVFLMRALRSGDQR